MDRELIEDAIGFATLLFLVVLAFACAHAFTV